MDDINTLKLKIEEKQQELMDLNNQLIHLTISHQKNCLHEHVSRRVTFDGHKYCNESVCMTCKAYL